ncbi:MAG: DUF177 domain-containing protein [Thermodesulfovibrionales bacterium]
MALDVEETIHSELVKVVSPARASLRIEKREAEVLVQGEVQAEVELQCSRCLQGFTVPVRSSLSVVYDPAESISREENYSLKGDELDMGFYRNDTLDLNDLLLEQMLLNIPMKPLCRPDCKGICPQCGKDLTAEKCACEVSEIDPRMKVLEQLLKRKE